MSEQNGNMMAPTLKEKHSVTIRLWHWGNFLIICGSLLTVLIASTILKPRYVIPSFQAAAAKNDFALNADQAKVLARSLNHTIWDWHKYFGIALATLFMLRIIFSFFEPADEGFFHRIKSARKYLRANPTGNRHGEVRHYYLVKLLYALFYISLGVMVLTGLSLAFIDHFFNFLKPAEETIKDIHSFNMYVILTFIAIHLGGVVLAELGKYKGVVSGMFNGE
jgi:Ni/Fe-hydrogenase 1 B-type cytochrome subunit